MENSSLNQINAAIQEENPFEPLPVVKDPDIWEKHFPDIPEFNAHASNAVFNTLDKVSNNSSGRNKVTSLVITAGKGVGKSHIISRIRNHVKTEKNAFFIYAGVEKYALNSVNAEFQQTLAESLDKIGSEGYRQWQELASSMANKVWKSANSNAETPTVKTLIKKINHSNNSEDKVSQWVEIMTRQFSSLPRQKRIDPDLVRAIFWTLSEPYSIYAIKWLSGKDLSENKAKQLDLPLSSADWQDSESRAFDNICQILSLISEYKPLIVAFDELDILDTKRSKAGLGRPHIIARFIKILVDGINLSDSSQGIVILTVMMPDTWTKKVKQMPGGVIDRVSASSEPIQLKFMDGDSVIKLVALWLNDFYKKRNLKPPTAIHPFTEEQLRNLGNGNTVREILKWCAKNISVTPPPLAPPPPVRQAYQKEIEFLESSKTDYIDDEDKIANSLTLAFKVLEGETVEGFKIQNLDKNIEPKSDNSNYIKFKIVGTKKEQLIKIGILVCQKTHFNSESAALSRIIAYRRFNINRGCLVRSKIISENHSKAQQYLNKLLLQGGMWVNFNAEEIKPLLAIWAVYRGRNDYNLKSQQIVDFTKEQKIASNNPIIHRILSEPTGNIPEGLTND